MANSQTVSYTTLISSTYDNTKAEVADGVFKKSAFWAKMYLDGNKEFEDGGHQIRRAVEVGTNETVGSYEGLDSVDLTPNDPITDAYERWAEIAGSVSVSAREKAINRGKWAVRNFVETKISNLQRSFGEKMNGFVLNPTGTNFSAGNGGKDPVPLTSICTLAATDVHNLSVTTYPTQWDNQRKASSATTYAAFKNELRNFYNTCSKHNEGTPNFILADQLVREAYEASLEGQVRYGSTNMADLGFETVMLGRAEFAWDQIVPGTVDISSASQADWRAYDNVNKVREVAFFLNTDYLKWVSHVDRDMEMSPFADARVNGQTAESALIELMGNLICTNRRVQGLFYDIHTSTLS